MLGERADTRRISIHAPPRGATHGGGVLLVSLEMISIHAPPRGATKRHSTSWKRSLFQFTPLREGRRAPRSHATPPTNFNSRPSARGDIAFLLSSRNPRISIHAPPRGATSRLREIDSHEAISIHAPPRGATKRAEAMTVCIAIFQFTPLREGRREICLRKAQRGYFNSRPSARGDLHRIRAVRDIPDFNSRPSARGDSRAKKACWRYSYFNSRPSARGDATWRKSSCSRT